MIPEESSSDMSSVSDNSLLFLRNCSISATLGLYEDNDPEPGGRLPSETMLITVSLLAMVFSSDLISPLEISQNEVKMKTIADEN